MVLVVRSLRPGDLAALSAVAAEVMARPYLDGAEELPAIASDPYASVALSDDLPVAAGGLADQGHGVAIAWAVFAPAARRLAVPLFRAFSAALREAPFHWIEAHIPEDLSTAMRFDRLLGFVPLNSRIATPDGREFLRFVYGR